ncbi:MAG: GNAT family N-acetyltransferase [Butyrivibrio sp.]
MERLVNFTEYRELIKEVKASGNKVFSNIYSLPAEMKEYIKAERMYYEKCAAGVIFYLDEGKYYKVYLCVDEQKEMKILPKEKKLLIKNVYNKCQSIQTENLLEHSLLKNGFYKAGVVLQVRAECSVVMKKSSKIDKFVRMMNRNGYYCISADQSMQKEIEALIDHDSIIQDYHIEYRTEEEKYKDIEQGLFLCIVDKQKEICAASIATIQNGIAEGVAIAVREEYKMNGFAPVLTYERCKRLYDQGVYFINGWILENNDASIKYHKSMGYQFTGHCADEWILEKTK